MSHSSQTCFMYFLLTETLCVWNPFVRIRFYFNLWFTLQFISRHMFQTKVNKNFPDKGKTEHKQEYQRRRIKDAKMASEYSVEELERICGKLQRKVTRYETRLSDVVSAYKQLAEEKQVLEDTVKALSANSDKLAEPKKDESNLRSFLQKSKELVTKSKQPVAASELNIKEEPPIQEEDDSKETLEKKFTALSAAFQSLTENKSKMESAFQADKKVILSEHNALVKCLKEEKNTLEERLDKIQGQLSQEQKERGNEVTNNSVMMRELQNVITEERLQKDELQSQLAELKRKLSQETETKIEEKKKPEHNSNEEGGEEVEKIKKNLVEEQQKAKESEHIFQIRQQQEEDRIYHLENKVSELSAAIGRYEVQRNEDQQHIKSLQQKLKSHLEELEKTNTVNHIQNDESKDEKFAPVEKYPSRTRTRSSMSESDPVDSPLLQATLYEFDDEGLHQKCLMDYKILKIEFENYKVKSQKRQNDYEKQNEKVQFLRREKEMLREEFSKKEQEFVEMMSKIQLENTRLSDNVEKQIDGIKECHMKEITSIQVELQKQRNRSIELLKDKDHEIEKLQKLMYDQEDGLFSTVSRRQQQQQYHQQITEYTTHDIGTEENTMEEILAVSPSKSKEGSLFHFIEQTTHEQELVNLRGKVLDLQESNRDYENREEHILQQMQVLKDEIRRLERNRSRESANLEYLKNLCFRYMTTTSSSVKQQMSVAISSILQFSSSELQQLQQLQKAGWW